MESLFELDFRSHVPIYLQIVERMQALIAAGVLGPGDQLPTVRQLAADLRVNFNTIARAYRMLDEAGVISTQQGRGTFVLEPPPPERARELRQRALRSITRMFIREGAQMGFGAAELEAAFSDQLEHWRTEGTPPEDEG
jgi:GntR family transcriptional regulator